jgi:molybdate transport system substrate-binding protein
VIARLPNPTSRAIEDNIRSNEPDVAGVTAKVVSGAVDAGFIYVTDVEATKGKLDAIRLDSELEPHVAYAIAVVRDTGNDAAAERFVDGLLAGDGRSALRRAGFGLPHAK